MATQLPHMDYEYLRAKIGGRTSAKIAPNTYAVLEADERIRVYLHDNLVAQLSPNGMVYLDDAGWATPTTARRLRALAPTGHRVYLHNGYTWVTLGGGKESLRVTGGVLLASDSR